MRKKRALAAGVAVSLIIQSSSGIFASSYVRSGRHEDGVISSSLLSAMEEEADEYPVIIWTTDIDHNLINEQIEQDFDYDWSTIKEDEDAVIGRALTRNGLKEAAEDNWYYIDEIYRKEMSEIQEKSNELIMAERILSKAEYLAANGKFATEVRIGDKVFFMSGYAPMVFAYLSREEIVDLSENETVTALSLYEEPEYEETDDVIEPFRNSSLDYLYYISAFGPRSAGIQGAGVKVGLYDYGLVYNTDDQLGASNIVTIGSNVTTNRNHAIHMAQIICGTYGVTPQCTLYSVDRGACNSLYAANELLLDQGVNVISNSRGISRSSDYYCDMEKWIDHIAAQHSVTYVKAAGNDSGDIAIPGLSYNEITVGNVDYQTDQLVSSSNYGFGNGCQKPDVVAPGAGVLNSSGTSAATAVTAGVVAMMMGYKPSIKNQPPVVKAVLMAGCDHYAGSNSFTSGFHYKQGAGVINCSYSLAILSANHYCYYCAFSNSSPIYHTVSVTGGTSHAAAFAGTKYCTSTSPHSNGTPSTVCNMPTTTFSAYTTGGTLLTTDNTGTTSARILRYTSSDTSYKLKLTASNVPGQGMPYAFAWR